MIRGLLNIGSQEQRVTRARMWVLILVSYGFGVVLRALLAVDAGEVDAFSWNGSLLLSSVDGYSFGSSVQNALGDLGVVHARMEHWYTSALVLLGTVFSGITPFSTDSVLFYMPVFFAPLIVVPVIAIGRLLGSTWFGFFAALVASVASSYYARTIAGYFDTDLYIVTLPLVAAYLMMRAVKRQSLGAAAGAGLVVAVSPYFHPAVALLFTGLVGMYGVYVVLFERRSHASWSYLALGLLGLMPFVWPVNVALVVAGYLALRFGTKELRLAFVVAGALALAAIVVATSGLLESILVRTTELVDRGAGGGSVEKYLDTTTTVAEAIVPPFEVVARRIAGGTWTFVVGAIGYLLLCIRYPVMIVTLPLTGLGLFAFVGGARFTIFATPTFALGGVFAAFVAGRLLAGFLFQGKPEVIARWAVSVGVSLAILYPNAAYTRVLPFVPALQDQEAELLDGLRKVSGPDDYALAWWDYGYPLEYFGEKQTLVDGGKHGYDNFITARILTTSNPLEVVNLGRLAVETHVLRGMGKQPVAPAILQAARKQGFEPPDFLRFVGTPEYEPPAATRDVYLYLPYRMSLIFQVIQRFSNRDLATGKKGLPPVFLFSPRVVNEKERPVVRLSAQAHLDKTTNEVVLGRVRHKLKQVYVVTVDEQGVLTKEQRPIHADGFLTAIVLKDHNAIMIVGDAFLESTYVKMFGLDEYDPELFEPVVRNRFGAVFKLKR